MVLGKYKHCAAFRCWFFHFYCRIKLERFLKKGNVKSKTRFFRSNLPQSLRAHTRKVLSTDNKYLRWYEPHSNNLYIKQLTGQVFFHSKIRSIVLSASIVSKYDNVMYCYTFEYNAENASHSAQLLYWKSLKKY